jgi:5-formyltetrahydrofolate cyclo-ligase
MAAKLNFDLPPLVWDEIHPFEKPSIRQAVFAYREQLDWQSLSLAICHQVERSTAFQTAEAILTFSAKTFEVNLSLLQALYPSKSWFLPRVLNASDMNFIKLDEATVFKKSAFGILEPVYHPNEVIWEHDLSKSIVLSPCLAADEHETRLGYGRGYYDRFFRDVAIHFITVCPESLLSPLPLPSNQFDKRVNEVFTETRRISSE